MPFMSRASIEALAESHNEMAHQMDKIALMLTISDPKVSVSADAYEGLRKTVMAASSERRAHLAQLAQLCDAIDRGVSAADFRTLLSEWCEQVSLVATNDTRDPGLFQVVAGDGDVLEVISPAWIDTTSLALVRQGQARLTTSTPADNAPPDPAIPDPADTRVSPSAVGPSASAVVDQEEPVPAAPAEATHPEGEEV